jgi:hypothetical protein
MLLVLLVLLVTHLLCAVSQNVRVYENMLPTDLFESLRAELQSFKHLQQGKVALDSARGLDKILRVSFEREPLGGLGNLNVDSWK